MIALPHALSQALSLSTRVVSEDGIQHATAFTRSEGAMQQALAHSNGLMCMYTQGRVVQLAGCLPGRSLASTQWPLGAHAGNANKRKHARKAASPPSVPAQDATHRIIV